MTEENSAPPADSNQIIEERRAKLAALRADGNAFPNDFRRSDYADVLHGHYDEVNNEDLEARPIEAAVAGRMMLKRVMGKASFATLQDMSGQIQIYITNDGVGEAAHEAFKHYDLGDILGARGHLFKTKTGELSIRVNEIRLLAKSLRPLPEKFHGLSDQEQKYRQRYLDLITNPEARRTFIIRSKITQALRDFFLRREFLEVETPMMHPIPGGAAARPFVTHHNALDIDLYLRIAPELYLKRLVVGGFEKVFEINRNFRNEGLSPRHNPEFTMLEFYEAYKTYEDMMDCTETLLYEVAEQINGIPRLVYQGQEIDFARRFPRLSMIDAIRKYHPMLGDEILLDPKALRAHLQTLAIESAEHDNLATLQLKLFEETTEHLIFEPTFIVDYPADVSPLARRSDLRPEITERFELFIAGREIANGFSELNDPEDQAARFMEQVKQKDRGDHEAMHYDADYIRALEYGLPPTAGEGIGIDRLVMLFTDSASIRDVILFPQMRPE